MVRFRTCSLPHGFVGDFAVRAPPRDLAVESTLVAK